MMTIFVPTYMVTKHLLFLEYPLWFAYFGGVFSSTIVFFIVNHFLISECFKFFSSTEKYHMEKEISNNIFELKFKIINNNEDTIINYFTYYALYFSSLFLVLTIFYNWIERILSSDFNPLITYSFVILFFSVISFGIFNFLIALKEDFI